MTNETRRYIWRIAVSGNGLEEWEVVEIPADPTREAQTLMISTLEACQTEYPDALVQK